MTIDERVMELAKDVPYSPVPATVFLHKLRRAMQAVARDQRHACAEAVAAMEPTQRTVVQGCILKDEAHQAVMNAEIE